jgi:hypothetical protein
MSVIRISQLDPIASNISSDDFFPLVDSASLTTYRAPISLLNSILMMSSSMYVSGSINASSSLYASSSKSSSHALLADNVSLRGVDGYVPFWNYSGYGGQGITNGTLKTTSPLQVSYSAFAFDGILGIGQDALRGGNIPADPAQWRQDYTSSRWYRTAAHTPVGGGYYGLGGLSVTYPIISTFVGTDQMMYNVATASSTALPYGGSPAYTNLVWSGSSASGSYKTISNTAGNTLSESFNGRWVRVACVGNWGGGLIAPNAAKGETGQGQSSGLAGGLFGRVMFVLNTSQAPGSNVSQVIDMNIHDQVYGNGLTANVDWAGVYQTDIIKKIRLSVHTPYSGSPEYYPGTDQSKDSLTAIDLFIDSLNQDDYKFNLGCYSWGGVRFLDQINLEPPPLINTGSKGFPETSKATYLVFPPEPGFYTSLDKDNRNYNIHGLPVTIWPTRNEVTRSAKDIVANRNLYSLNVSGTVNATEKYYCSGSEGKTGTFTQYTGTNWKSCVYKGGILVDSSSVATSPLFTHAVTASWASSSLSSSWLNPSASHPGMPRAWAMCLCTASTDDPNHSPGDDWHWTYVNPAFNVRSVTKAAGAGTVPAEFPLSPEDGPVLTTEGWDSNYVGASTGRHWLVTLNTTMSSTNYMVIGNGAQTGKNPNPVFPFNALPSGYCSMTMFPNSKRTTTQFTLSMAQSVNMDFAHDDQLVWFNFFVYENPTNIGVTYPGW